MKKREAWAIVEGDKMILADERCPVYWLQSVAEEFRKTWNSKDVELVRVEIREVKPARRKRK